MKIAKFDFSKIPFISAPDSAITSDSQEHLPVADIVEDIVLYKDGGAALIMETTSLNFGLLSEKEQEAVVYAYAALLNSLSFSIQIFIRSQRKDLTTYLNYLDKTTQSITNQKLLGLLAGYRKFIIDSVKKKNVLGKKFYIIIPFSPYELGVGKSAASILKKGALPFPKSYVIKKSKTILYPRRDHLIRQAGRFGIKLRQLANNEIVELFYNVYNPEIPGVKKIQNL